MSSRLRSKKYDIVRSQSLHRPKDGISGTYRSLCSSPQPWSVRATRQQWKISDSDGDASSFYQRPPISRSKSDHSLEDSLARAKDTTVVWLPPSGKHVTNSTMPQRRQSSRRMIERTTNASHSRSFPSRRVPFELFDDLPESKVDPDVNEEQKPNQRPRESEDETKKFPGVKTTSNESNQKQPNTDKPTAEENKKETCTFQVVFIQHKPKYDQRTKSVSSDDNQVLDDDSSRSFPAVEQNGSCQNYEVCEEYEDISRHGEIEYQEISNGIYVTSATKDQSPRRSPRSDNSLLCQESPQGTVFGVLGTPTSRRRNLHTPSSAVTLTNRYNGSLPRNSFGRISDTEGSQSFCYFYDNGNHVVSRDDVKYLQENSLHSLPQSLSDDLYHPNGQINECYNFRLILPKEVQAKRQDFCRSMLSQDGGDTGRRTPSSSSSQRSKSITIVNGNGHCDLPPRTPPQLVRERYSSSAPNVNFRLTRNPFHSGYTKRDGYENRTGQQQAKSKPSAPSLQSPMVVKEVLKKMASQPSGMLPDSNTSQKQGSQFSDKYRRLSSPTDIKLPSRSSQNGQFKRPDTKPLNELDPAEAEAMKAIQDLDKSLSEALESTSLDVPPPKHNKDTTTGPKSKFAIHRKSLQQQGSPRYSEKSSPCDDQLPDSGGVESDNLIEELYLSESKPKVSNSSATFNGYSSQSKMVDRYDKVHSKGHIFPDRQKDSRDIEDVNATNQIISRVLNSNFILKSNQSPKTHAVNGNSRDGSLNGRCSVAPIQRTSYPGPISQFYRRYRPDFTSNGVSGPHYPASMNDNTAVCAEIHQAAVDSDGVDDDLEGAVVARTSTSSVDSGTSSHHQGHFVVVAIDFGTTYSGYAFSFTRDPENIHMMRKWEGGDPGVNNQKTPTTLLLTPSGQFHSFGFTARDFYNDMETQESKKWMYFEKFKMSLHHNENLTRETQILAANGKAMSAVTVFAHALRYFRDHALQELSDQSATPIMNEDVRWVVTVPAIWRQPAKQFMRTAAYEAGIASPEYSDQLLIALEPEAASIYCRRLRMHQLVPEGPLQNRLSVYRKNTEMTEVNSDPAVIEEKDFYMKYSSCINDVLDHATNTRSTLDRGLAQKHGTSMRTRYMVVDCGGGTVDITVHELQDKQGTLKELHKATGGPHGSVGVDMQFECLLEDIFGADFIAQFKQKRPASFVDLMNAFEARKRNANPFQNNPLNISLPFSFIDFYKKCKGSIESAIKKYGDKDIQYRSSQGMIRLEAAAMLRLFEPTLTKIKEHISEILNNPKVQKINYLFLVGGFAESRVLQKAIREEFSSRLTVIIPQGVSLAVLRGAVLFGLDPTIVNVRRSRMTYGVGILNRFINGVHPPEKLVVKDGIQWCADVFDKFVTTDQSVGLGDVVRRSYTPATAGQSCSIIHIYCSERDDVQFITDSGVQRCGTLMLDLTDSKQLQNISRREIETCMTFGDTEIKASARDVASGKCVKVEIDFLNR